MDGPRSLRPDEFASLCELVNTIFRPDGSGRMEAQYPLLFGEANYENLLVMADGERIVSHVGTLTRDISILGHTIKTMSIGAVGTYEAYRGQGLATQLMEEAIRRGRAQGSVLMLISGGRGLYRRLGSVRAGRYVGYAAHRNGMPDGAGFEVTAATYEDMPALTRLYAHEAIRYHRTVEDFATVANAGWVCDRSGETLAIRHKGSLVAYAGVQRPRPVLPDERAPVRLVEIAGARAAVVHALPNIMDRYGTTDADVIALDADAEMRHLIQPYATSIEPQGFMGTMIILLPDRFIEIVSDYIRMMSGTKTADRLQWSVTGEGVVVSCGDRAASFGGSSLAQLCFGVVDPDADHRLAIPQNTELHDALDTVFPVQLPWYGYNFV